MRKCRIGILLSFIVMLTACASNANVPEVVVPVQPEVYVVETDSEIGVDESDIGETSEATEQKVESEEANETSENSAETAETDESDATDIVYLKPCNTYQDILDNVYELIMADNTIMNNIESNDGMFSCGEIREAKIGRDTDEALTHIGYAFYDVDGNGIEELIIMDTDDNEGNWDDVGRWDNRILSMYSLLNDAPVLIISGGDRNRYYLLNDGTIYYEGSGGAAYSAFATYRMAADGVSLIAIDFYYSDYLDDSIEDYQTFEWNWGWFHNTTGEWPDWPGDESEIVEFEDQDVPWEMMDAYLAQVKKLDLTFFEEMKK